MIVVQFSSVRWKSGVPGSSSSWSLSTVSSSQLDPASVTDRFGISGVVEVLIREAAAIRVGFEGVAWYPCFSDGVDSNTKPFI